MRRLRWLSPLVLLGIGATNTEPISVERRDVQQIQELVDSVRGRLSIAATVTVKIVPANALLVSVEPLQEQESIFLLSFEEGFANGLDPEELRAVVAHELGHVWIFTHHPFLQTERLANEIAMRVVSRESLERVYSKVWERRGTKGDLSRFLGH